MKVGKFWLSFMNCATRCFWDFWVDVGGLREWLKWESYWFHLKTGIL
jgi:hypothetical protein